MIESRGDRALRRLSRFLPSEFRERVFEPALSDLHLEEAEQGSRRSARVILAIECLRIGLPQHLWRRRRATRFGVAVGVATIVVALVLVRLHATAWPPEPARRATPAAQGPR
jgi:hypothetical protein